MKIPLAIGLSLSYVFTVVTCSRSTGSQLTNIRQIGIRDPIGTPTKQRVKRAKFLLDIGATAVDILLDGARKITSYSKRWKKYEKQGNLFTAVSDFNKVKPTNVFKYRKQSGVMLEGDLGDRTIYLKIKDRQEKGSPSITVFDPKKGSEQQFDKIVYRKILQTTRD